MFTASGGDNISTAAGEIVGVEINELPMELYELSGPEQKFKSNLDNKMVGQPQAKQLAQEAYRAYLNPLRDCRRPIFIGFLLGPTGVGKTLLAQLLAEEFHGSRDALIRVNCSAYKHHSDLTKLFGAGATWIGYKDPKDKPPEGQLDSSARLTAHNLIASRRGSKAKVTVVLLDEFEKGCEELQQAFLAIFDNGKEHMANNLEVDFSDCIFLLTSNLGMAEAEQKAAHSFGFVQTEHSQQKAVEDVVERTWLERFSPEFRNRIDQKVIYSALSATELRAVVDVEIGLIRQDLVRRLGTDCFELVVEQSAKDFLLAEATKEGGARSIKRTLHRHISRPIGTAVINKSLASGHRLVLSHRQEEERLRFVRGGEAKAALKVAPPAVLAGATSLNGRLTATTSGLAESDRLFKWALSLREERKFAESITCFETALLLLEPGSRAHLMRRASIYNQIGNCYWAQSQFLKAAFSYELALSCRRQVVTRENAANSPQILWLYSNLAGAYLKLELKPEFERVSAEGIEAIKTWPSNADDVLKAVAALFDYCKAYKPEQTEALDELMQRLKDGRF